MKRQHPNHKKTTKESTNQSFEDPIAEQAQKRIKSTYPELETENRSQAIFFDESVSLYHFF